MNSTNDISRRQAAILVGIGFLITFGGGMVPITFSSELMVAGDPVGTAESILDNEMLFRAGIVGSLFMVVGDLVRAWAYYVFFRSVNQSVALLSAWFMLMHVAIFGATQIGLLVAAQILTASGASAAFDTDQLHVLMSIFLSGEKFGYNLGIFFFSFHLLFLGYLALESSGIPRILGAMLVAAFVGYLFDSLGHILVPAYPERISQVLLLPLFVGELGLILWLVSKGGKTPA